jgi:hypothetical protein
LATMHAESLYSRGFASLRRFDFAWLSEAEFRRLLPVCCPASASLKYVERRPRREHDRGWLRRRGVGSLEPLDDVLEAVEVEGGIGRRGGNGLWVVVVQLHHDVPWWSWSMMVARRLPSQRETREPPAFR